MFALMEYIEHMKRTLRRSVRAGTGSSGVVRKYVDGSGARHVQGGPLLKTTKVYTSQCGGVVAGLHKKRSMADFLKQAPRNMLARDMPEVDVDTLPVWHDAKLELVERYMKRRGLRLMAKA